MYAPLSLSLPLGTSDFYNDALAHTPLGIKKRNHKLLDYDATRARVKKLVEKPDKDPSKLPRAERESELAKTAYEALNEQLFSELPQLIDLRVPYLDPSFEALVKIQLRFCAEDVRGFVSKFSWKGESIEGFLRAVEGIG